MEIDIGLDGRFRITEVGGLTMAARGAWFNEGTLWIGYQAIGQGERGIIEFGLAEEVASMRIRELNDLLIPRSWADRVE
jgi:hypothetical protein